MASPAQAFYFLSVCSRPATLCWADCSGEGCFAILPKQDVLVRLAETLAWGRADASQRDTKNALQILNPGINGARKVNSFFFSFVQLDHGLPRQMQGPACTTSNKLKATLASTGLNGGEKSGMGSTKTRCC